MFIVVWLFFNIFTAIMLINCSIDGKPIRKDRAVVSVFDNALFYADGLFETMLAIGDRVISIDDHLRRMKFGMDILSLKLPCSSEQIK
jgi:branched-subunit amino acid aminotransferase/4-amino-4-deoxychorismate lyase